MLPRSHRSPGRDTGFTGLGNDLFVGEAVAFAVRRRQQPLQFLLAETEQVEVGVASTTPHTTGSLYPPHRRQVPHVLPA